MPLLTQVIENSVKKNEPFLSDKLSFSPKYFLMINDGIINNDEDPTKNLSASLAQVIKIVKISKKESYKNNHEIKKTS